MSNKLDYLGFRKFSPSSRLSPYIHNYWFIARDAELHQHRGEFLHPEGGFGLIINFADAVTINGQAIHETAFLDGTGTRSSQLLLGKKVRAVGIRFKPGGAFPFFPVPIKELHDQNIPLSDINLPGMENLCCQLYAATGWQEKITILENWLVACMYEPQQYDLSVPAAIALIKNRQGNTRIETLAESLSISRRSLERNFNRYVGMSPKTFARLVRIKCVHRLMKQTPEANIVDLGLAAGYYDHAHMTREFKAIVGFSPSHYKKLKQVIER